MTFLAAVKSETMIFLRLALQEHFIIALAVFITGRGLLINKTFIPMLGQQTVARH